MSQKIKIIISLFGIVLVLSALLIWLHSSKDQHVNDTQPKDKKSFADSRENNVNNELATKTTYKDKVRIVREENPRQRLQSLNLPELPKEKIVLPKFSKQELSRDSYTEPESKDLSADSNFVAYEKGQNDETAGNDTQEVSAENDSPQEHGLSGEEMNLKNPPQWNKSLALPKVPSDPPDPYITPPVHVDPQRKPEPDAPRLSAGTFENISGGN